MPVAQRLGVAHMAYACARTGRHRRRQRSREDETITEGAHKIDQIGRCRYITADHAKGLAQRALDDVDAIHHAFALGDPRAVRAVHANRVNLVEESDCVVFFGDVADLGDRRDIAIHRVNRLENNDFRHVRVIGRHQSVEISRIVMLKNAFFGAGMTDALDHRIMIQRIRIEDTARQLRAQRGQGRHVGDIARGKQQRRFLAVQAGQFLFKKHMVMVGAGDIARATGTGAALVDRLNHGIAHQFALPHAQIIV